MMSGHFRRWHKGFFLISTKANLKNHSLLEHNVVHCHELANWWAGGPHLPEVSQEISAPFWKKALIIQPVSYSLYVPGWYRKFKNVYIHIINHVAFFWSVLSIWSGLHKFWSEYCLSTPLGATHSPAVKVPSEPIIHLLKLIDRECWWDHFQWDHDPCTDPCILFFSFGESIPLDGHWITWIALWLAFFTVIELLYKVSK